MSVQRLRTFVEVYRQRSISSAARSLGLTQPAVSQHIAALETAVGHPLFERESRGVLPTAAARELAADLGDTLDVAEAALASARARSADMSGVIQIAGNGDFLSEVVAPRLIPLLEIGMRVRLQAGDRVQVEEMLVNGACDLGIFAYPVEDQRLRSEKIRDETMSAVAAPAVAARIAAAADLSSGLAAEPMLTYSLERPLLNDWLEHNALTSSTRSPAVIGQDLRGLCSLLRAGVGWSVLPRYLSSPFVARGELAEIPSPNGAIRRPYFLVWAPSALRQPRIAHARQTLLWGLSQDVRP
ncbi:LysR family transcriptional regulator [Caulobacter sp.]|jgi:DNA-binding transcriptional LysR family regulator|uniref:LysR family transcriptional regulator n=1 Tax=Caulobacter sp. TaxID=78 RepID=UPI0031CEFDF5